MSIAYYPGCSGQGTSLEYDRSTRAVCAALGLSLRDVSDWSCCGSTPAHAVDHTLSTALSARNIMQAKIDGAERITTPCPSCLANLKTARHRLRHANMRAAVREILDTDLPEHADDLPDVFSVLQLLVEDVGLAAIEKLVKRPLTGLKIAPYYGCLMSRPAGIMQFDDPEHPTAMDKVLEALGMEVIDFSLKTECCGAAMGIPRREVTARLSGRILETARNYGADVIAVACPLCHMNLDLRQGQAASALRTAFDLPVLYFTQLMGLAFCLPESDLMLGKLCVSPAGLQDKLRESQAPRPAQNGETKEKASADAAKADGEEQS
ncbi:MAG: CoB--CoM heterodisulfide reductase iron-sulfur subunit B family protein [Deltaproteobacteria bacterium]|jgi:heterodisulfide reductase subunit B|nr:CoB--CoM heterodisulfide reductase iron-sulfur subunit B family protein [Deltaproteobacteria bacterium]